MLDKAISFGQRETKPPFLWRLWRYFSGGSFPWLDDDQLREHHLAIESAWMRQARLGHVQQACELARQYVAIEREMHWRGLL